MPGRLHHGGAHAVLPERRRGAGRGRRLRTGCGRATGSPSAARRSPARAVLLVLGVGAEHRSPARLEEQRRLLRPARARRRRTAIARTSCAAARSDSHDRLRETEAEYRRAIRLFPYDVVDDARDRLRLPSRRALSSPPSRSCAGRTPSSPTSPTAGSSTWSASASWVGGRKRRQAALDAFDWSTRSSRAAFAGCSRRRTARSDAVRGSMVGPNDPSQCATRSCRIHELIVIRTCSCCIVTCLSISIVTQARPHGPAVALGTGRLPLLPTVGDVVDLPE